MKLRLVLQWFLVGLILILSVESSFALSYLAYEDFGGQYYDANKTWNDDGNLCWAAAASNALAFTGWGFPAEGGFSDEQEILAYFTQYWPNYGNNPLDGYTWWFTGTESNWPHPDVQGGGGFFSDIDPSSLYHSQRGSQIMVALDDYLHDGDGVTATVRRNDGSYWFHAISIYGYEYDEFGNYLGIYYVENHESSQTFLRYMPIYYNWE